MTCTVYQTNKKTCVTYAYRSESYRDPVTKKPKSRRVYLGRVDPETKQNIPKGEEGTRNRSPLGAPGAAEIIPTDLSALLSQQRETIASLQQTVAEFQAREMLYQEALQSIFTALKTLKQGLAKPQR